MALALPTGTPLTHGWFGNGHFGLMALLHGEFWCQPGDETYLVYRDDGAGTFDDCMPCARADEGDSSVTVAAQDLGTDNLYQYRRLAVSPAGSVSDVSSTVDVEVDGSGDLVGPIGNAATNLTATALSGGDVRLTWQYDPAGEPATPTGFKIYHSTDGGSNYTLDGTKAYREGMLRFHYTDASLSNGQAYTFKVVTYRTISLTDYELGDFPTDTATADSDGPAAVTGLTVTATNPA